MLFIRGAPTRIVCTTGPRFGSAARTSLALRSAARSAVTVNRPLARSHPVKTNSRSPTVIRCSSGESFKLSRRQSMPRLAANSVSTAARWRPARCTPPGASSSGKRPMSTGKVCQVPRPMASADASTFPLLTEGSLVYHTLGNRGEPVSKPSDLVQGTLDLLLLKILALQPMNGWAISLRLKSISGDVLQVSEGSPYPPFHKLEQQAPITAASTLHAPH